MRIAFERPYFLIMIPIVILVVIWIAKGLRMSNQRRKNKYTILRCLVAVLLILAMSGISVDKHKDITTTIFLVDVSDSMKAHQEEIQNYLAKTISDMPDKNRMGVVAFGADSKVEQFVTDQRIFTELGTHPVTTATNVENAITAALSLFPDDTAKRIVLISDGQENEGSMLNMSSALQTQNVELAVIPMEWEIGEEVYVDNLTVPDTIREGDQYAITVNVVSNVDTDATVSLYSGRTMKGTEDVYLTAGENQFVFYDTADSDGFRSYRVEVKASHDTLTVNNEYSTYAQIESKARILVVEGQKGEGAAFEKMLQAAGVLYDMVTPTGVPADLNQMLEYKTIVLLNVYYDDLKEGFVNNIKGYVKDYAGGLIVTGGDNSYALGNYRGTPLEEVLPVNVDLEGERQIPKMEIDLVIDHSGSMSMTAEGSAATSLDLAKAAAIKALESLRKTDRIGVLAFDDMYTWVVDPQAADHIDEITQKIGSIEIGGGTNIYPAVEQAVSSIAQSDAQIKHVILLTDGEDTYNDYEDLISKINDNNITLSTVAVGEGANVQLMSSLAEACNGRYYYTDISQGLPRIFAKEVFIATKEYLINEEFTPVIAANNDMIRNFADGFPTLKGYIAATAKPTATTVLASPKEDPVLSEWQYGLGKCIAWNSDVTGEWSGNFTTWDRYVEFWKGILDYSITKTDLGDDSLSVKQEGSTAYIEYTTKDYDANTKITGVCTDEKGNTVQLEFDPVTPGTYKAEITTDEVGVYNIALKNASGDETVKSVNTATAMQYSAEYRFSSSTDSLSKLTTLVGGHELTMNDVVFLPMEHTVKAKVNIGTLLVLSALVLFMLDVVERRLNLDLLAKLKWPRRQIEVETKIAAEKPQRRVKMSEQTAGREKPQKKKHMPQKKNSEKKTKEPPKTLDTNALLKRQQERNKHRQTAVKD